MFQYGQRGDNFYVIIEGEVDVLIPSPVELKGKMSSPAGILTFLIQSFEQIAWDRLEGGRSTRNWILAELR